MVGPFQNIWQGVENIGKGNFESKIDTKSNDEFGQVAMAINEMAGKLKKSYGELDEKVKLKTQALLQSQTDLEKRQIATLNVLEDVEKEKEKTQLLANDLEKFKLAVDSVSDQIVITVPEGIVIYGNNAVEKITGFKPEEALNKKAGVLWKTPITGLSTNALRVRS
jgi:nitrate/nitrite-specific signal transduction histidine kinase